MANSHVLGDNPDLTCLIKAARMRQADSGQPPLEVSFIHQLDVYSAPPEVLVAGLENNGAGRWFFIGPAEYLAEGGVYRHRTVADAGRDGHTCWHPERRVDLKDPDGNTVGLFRALSYVTKRKGEDRKRQGWTMNEYTLAHHVGADELVLCEVYRSNSNTTMGSISSDLFHGLEHPNIAAATGTTHTMCCCAASIGKRPDTRILPARSNNLGDNEAPQGQVTNITVVVNDSEAMRCLEALNSAFSERKVKSSPIPVNSSSAPAASSGSKRKVAEDEDHPETRPAGRRQTNPQTPCSVLQQTDEEVQEADLEFNNNTIPADSSTEISSEPIHYNHPEPPQDMTDTGGRLTPEKEIQMPTGVQAHQDLNSYIYMNDEPELRTGVQADQDLNNYMYMNDEHELPTEVMGCVEFANPAYETWYPTEDGWAIHLGHDEYPDLVIDPLWVFSE